jgi:hypothetical protein
MEAPSLFDADDLGRGVFASDRTASDRRTLSARRTTEMKNLRIAVAAAAAAASAGLASLVVPPAAMNQADCPAGWYWDNERQNCLPPGLPKDPPNGCLTGDGTHASGTICIN